MLIQCNNLGCLKHSAALLNEETGEVICQECGKPIDNVSNPIKRVLKSFGQIARADRKSFMVVCRNCNANRTPVLAKDGDIVCKVCKKSLKLTPAFKMAMESSGVKLETLDDTKPTKEEERKD